MAKYDGLRDHVRLQRGPDFSLTFGEFERRSELRCQKAQPSTVVGERD